MLGKHAEMPLSSTRDTLRAPFLLFKPLTRASQRVYVRTIVQGDIVAKDEGMILGSNLHSA